MGDLGPETPQAALTRANSLGRLARFEVYRYALPLERPLTLKGIVLHQRAGLLVRLTSESGHAGWGDVAPLPAFSRETVEEAQAQLFRLQPVLLGRPAIASGAMPSHSVLPELPREQLVSSVRFGLEQALWSLGAARAGTSLAAIMAPNPAPRVPFNALLMGTGDEVLEAARRIRAQGYPAVKLKVGRQSVEEDVALTRAVRGVLGPDVGFRLDANRAWTLSQATAFADGISGCRLEYTEEPLADATQMPALVAACGLPVALDESLVGLPVRRLSEHTYAHAIVLKPTLLGGLAHALKMAQQARTLGMKPVISSAFQSGVGLLALLALASATGEGRVPAGLDTYRTLAADVLRERLPLDESEVDMQALARRTWEIDEARLEKV